MMAMGPLPLAGQTVRGSVRDSLTSQRLVSASIELLGAEGRIVARHSSDDQGAFLVRAGGAGAYRIRVQRVGFRPFESSDLHLASSSDTILAVLLVPLAVSLPALEVAADRDPVLDDRGFYERKQSEVGRFVEPERIRDMAGQAGSAADLLGRIPGVSLGQDRNGMTVPQLRGCRLPLVFVDGARAGREVPGLLRPSDVLGIEIYSSGGIPSQFGGSSSQCGVILIWTKRY